MITKTVLFAFVAIAACTTASPQGPTLQTDAHLVGLVPPYASVDDCVAHETGMFACQFSISLCASGRTGMRSHDLVYEGTYYMDGARAEIAFDGEGFGSGDSMELDIDSGTSTGSYGANMWVPDTEDRWNTLQFDNIDCSQASQ